MKAGQIKFFYISIAIRFTHGQRKRRIDPVAGCKQIDVLMAIVTEFSKDTIFVRCANHDSIRIIIK